MSAVETCPVPTTKPDYEQWLENVRTELASMHIEMEAWRKNWAFDFWNEYDAGRSAHDAALCAHDFWWGELMTESWS